jgi:hypothetical protein
MRLTQRGQQNNANQLSLQPTNRGQQIYDNDMALTGSDGEFIGDCHADYEKYDDGHNNSEDATNDAVDGDVSVDIDVGVYADVDDADVHVHADDNIG